MEVSIGQSLVRAVYPRGYYAVKRLVRKAQDQLVTRSPRLAAVGGYCYHLATGRIAREDYLDRWLGKRDALTPPRRLLFDGTTTYRQFQQAGERFADYLAEHGFRSDHRVLEIGCGNGKNARGLTRYLTPPGSYDGIDVAPNGVAWCRQHFTPRFRHFRFQQADLYNSTYNPAGRLRAAEYRFPFADASFDLVFLSSVFTHLLPDEVDNYLGEIGRVLRTGGRCFASFFLLNKDSLIGVLKDKAAPAFRFQHGSPDCLIADPNWPEDAVAHDETTVRAWYARHGLQIEEPIVFGKWWQGEWNYQDVIWAVKR